MTVVQTVLTNVASSQRRLPQPSNLELASLLKLGNDTPVGVRYENIETVLDPATKTFWCWMRPQGKPIVTHGLLNDLSDMQASFKEACATDAQASALPFNYFVFASRSPGIFSLGGDLGHFVQCVQSGDRDTIHDYARHCVEIIHGNQRSFDLPVITMALVQGDALGGGFETALSFDMIVAEKSAKLGLPEILFNLFPGMGAYSFLSRRLDAVRARKLMLSGRIYTAEEMHEMGLVDILVEDGEGEAAIARYIAKMSPKHNAHLAINQTRRRVNPITWDELRDVVDIWVDAVFQLTEPDLRKMARLTTAQDRRLSSTAPTTAAALG